MNNFKVGDKVKCIGDTVNCKIGEIYVVTELKGDSENLSVRVSGNGREDVWVYEKYFNVIKDIAGLKNPTHVVVWDERDRDPHKFFTSLEEANKFIKELSEKTNVIKDSIVLVEIKKAEKIVINKVLRKSKLLI